MMWLNVVVGAIICIGVPLLLMFGVLKRECRIDETGRKICRWVWR
jgi:hypothetical protein